MALKVSSLSREAPGALLLLASVPASPGADGAAGGAPASPSRSAGVWFPSPPDCPIHVEHDPDPAPSTLNMILNVTLTVAARASPEISAGSGDSQLSPLNPQQSQTTCSPRRSPRVCEVRCPPAPPRPSPRTSGLGAATTGGLVPDSSPGLPEGSAGRRGSAGVRWAVPLLG